MNENKISEFMNDDPVYVSGYTRIAEIKYLLSKYNLEELFVVDEDKFPIGVVSFDDVDTKDVEQMDIPSDVSAIECMRKIPSIVMNNSTLQETLNIMRLNRVNNLAVVDNQGKFEGIIQKDIITKIIM